MNVKFRTKQTNSVSLFLGVGFGLIFFLLRNALYGTKNPKHTTCFRSKFAQLYCISITSTASTAETTPTTMSACHKMRSVRIRFFVFAIHYSSAYFILKIYTRDDYTNRICYTIEIKAKETERK